MLTRIFTLDPLCLRQAIAATFARRDTAIPALVPGGLSDAFATDPVAEAMGRVCKQPCRRVPEASVVVADIRQQLETFLGPT